MSIQLPYKVQTWLSCVLLSINHLVNIRENGMPVSWIILKLPEISPVRFCSRQCQIPNLQIKTKQERHGYNFSESKQTFKNKEFHWFRKCTVPRNQRVARWLYMSLHLQSANQHIKPKLQSIISLAKKEYVDIY